MSSSSYVNTLAKIIKIPGATVIPPSQDDIVGAARNAADSVGHRKHPSIGVG